MGDGLFGTGIGWDDAAQIGLDYWAGKDSARSGTDVGAEYGDAYKTSCRKTSICSDSSHRSNNV